MKIGTEVVPTQCNGRTVLNLDFSVSDRFLAQTSVAATIFVKRGDDFVRISTSVKNENGERAVGTVLDHSQASYKAVIAGQAYVGYAQIFGQQYMTK